MALGNRGTAAERRQDSPCLSSPPSLQAGKSFGSAEGGHHHALPLLRIHFTCAAMHPGCKAPACQSGQDQRHRVRDTELVHPVVL